MATEIQNIQQAQYPQGEIILYQPDETVRLEVRLENETVWLNQQQMAELFGTNRQAITKHLKNIYTVKELTKAATCSILELVRKEGNRMVARKIEFYNLDAIISVGFRVNTQRGIEFRIWANGVLKEHLLRGYSINERMTRIEQRVSATEEKIDFFVRTSLPPVVGVFSGGQVFSARLFVEDLVKMAAREVILIDNYVDAKTFDLLDVRADGVTATIYTERVDASLQRLQVQHNMEHPDMTVTVHAFSHPFHDRFLIVDDELWHCGASFKDL
ncbi:MAG: virulence RhuM family protein, partial [Prevotella sp.]|nr:virulence RhuM family protein [Prevotella sp.]